MSKRILITGGAGFVGSSLAMYLKQRHPEFHIFALDNLRRRGSELNVRRLQNYEIEFVHGDIRNPEDLRPYDQIDIIIDCSAEPSVLAGITSTPEYVVNTNLVGTINCLDLAVRAGAAFVFLSTSRVYPVGHLEKIRYKETETRFSISADQELVGVSERGISEQFPLEGFRSMYGATKLCSEILIAEYRNSYGLRAIVDRCGVLTGPWQMGKVDQGFVVLWMAKHFWERELTYLGYGGAGKQVRDVLHITDLCRLVEIQIDSIASLDGQTFNVGGGPRNCVSLRELTSMCQQITGNNASIRSMSQNREADIRIYVTDNSRVEQATNWSPTLSVEQTLDDIYVWIRDNSESLRAILS